MNDLKLALVLRLKDQLTEPLKRAKREIDAAGDQVVAGEERRRRQITAISAGALGVATAVMTGMAFAAGKAIEFESAMAGVTKVSSIEDQAELEKLTRDIQDLSTQIPLTQLQIAGIVEDASQANVVDRMLPDAEQRRQVIEFAGEVGRIAEAFDTSTESAREFYVGLVNRAGLSVAEAGLVADAINHLSNTTSSQAGDLMNMMVRVGGVGDMAGLSQVKIAALASAFNDVSPRADVAATAMGNFLSTFTKGEEATDRQAAGFQRLGLAAQDVAERMQTDAEGTIVDVLERIGRLSDVEKPQIISQLFGDGVEIVGPISSLVGNIEKIPEAFALVRDEQQYAGSAAAEFEARMGTTAAQLQIIQNRWEAIVTRVGTALLPHIKEFLDLLQTIITDIERWYGQLKEVVDRTREIGAAVRAVLTDWDAFKAKVGEVLDWVAAKAAEVGAAIRSALTIDGPALTVDRRLGLDEPLIRGGSGRTLWNRLMGDDAPEAAPPGRALGGHVRAGQVYEWQEEGAELFAPLVDGRVISNAALRRMGDAPARAGGGAVTIGDVHVHAAPGMSAAEVARAVRDELARLARSRSALHDGPLHA